MLGEVGEMDDVADVGAGADGHAVGGGVRADGVAGRGSMRRSNRRCVRDIDVGEVPSKRRLSCGIHPGFHWEYVAFGRGEFSA